MSSIHCVNQTFESLIMIGGSWILEWRASGWSVYCGFQFWCLVLTLNEIRMILKVYRRSWQLHFRAKASIQRRCSTPLPLIVPLEASFAFDYQSGYEMFAPTRRSGTIIASLWRTRADMIWMGTSCSQKMKCCCRKRVRDEEKEKKTKNQGKRKK